MENHAKLQYLLKTNHCNNFAPKHLLNCITNEFSKEELLSLLNDYFARNKCKNKEVKLLVALLHFNFKKCNNIEELEKLTKNLCRLLCGSQKSVVTILSLLKNILRDTRIGEKIRIDCLFIILVKVSRSLYPINGLVDDLCKNTVKFLAPDVQIKQFKECMVLIQKSLYADVHCRFLATIVKYLPLDILMDSTDVLLQYICAGFCENITAVQRSYLYKALVDRFEFVEWESCVFKRFVKLLEKYQSNECFMESLKCYFIPPTSIKYKEKLYIICRRFINNRVFSANVLAYLTRRNFCKASNYKNDIVAFSQNETTADVGFELLCKSNQLVQIVSFLYEYKWGENKKILCYLNQVDADLKDLFYFAINLLSSASRTHTEFGIELLKVIWEKGFFETKYLHTLFNLYLNNSAVTPEFIYDLVNYGYNNDLRDIIERNRANRNVNCITKVSFMQHVYFRTNGDLNFINDLKVKVVKIDRETFKDGCTLFYVKVFKLFCQDGEHSINYKFDDTFSLLYKTAITLLETETTSAIDTVDERKLYEALLSEVLTIMQFIFNKNKNDKELTQKLIRSCYLTIQLTNFKQPVSTASLILQQTASSTTTEELSNFVDTCFETMTSYSEYSSTIRCSAEYRLILESICVANIYLRDKIFIRLMVLLKNSTTNELAIVAILHTMDALFGNKVLQIVTPCYVEEVVELLLEKDWMDCFRTRNAVIQIWSTIINSFKNVPLENTFLEYPKLARIFYSALSKGVSERALLILSVFIECPRGLHFLKPNFDGVFNEFMEIFLKFIKQDRSYCGRLAAKAYAAQCDPDLIINVLISEIRIVTGNFVVLYKALIEKYLYYFDNRDVCRVFEKKVSLKLPVIDFNYGKVVLAVQKNDFNTLNTLIITTFNLQNNNKQLLEMYAHAIYLLYEKVCDLKSFKIFEQLKIKTIYSYYHLAVFALVFANENDFPKPIEKCLRKQLFENYNVLPNYIQDPDSLSFFANTLPYLYKCAKKWKEKLIVFRLALFSMMCGETDKEFCKFIAAINNKSVSSFMYSVKELYIYEKLLEHLKTRHAVIKFLIDTSQYFTQLEQIEEAFYSVDTESNSVSISEIRYLVFKCFQNLCTIK